MRQFIAAATLVFLLVTTASPQEKEKPLIQDYLRAAIGAPPESLHLDPFYGKYTDALCIAVVKTCKRMTPNFTKLLGRVYADHHIPMDVYYGKNISPQRRRQ